MAAQPPVLEQQVHQAHQRHRGRELASFARTLEQRIECGQRGHRQRRRLAPARGQVAAQRHAPAAHVLEFARALFELQVGKLVQLRVGDRQAEAVAEGLERGRTHLLLLMSDVLRLARFAHAIALDRLGEDDGRLAGVIDGRV
ncbi:MAG: hypothetical protein COW56_10245, partial [Rhodocyclales bacterium CG17_big_fil_post_rev_8_21_14_2_50_68_7]